MQAGTKFKTVDEYIAAFPAKTKSLLKQIRSAIKAAAPGAEEVISYNMPAFKQEGVLVFYAAYKEHIGFYPTASGIANFKKEIEAYKNSKGAVQFPIDKPLPLDLVKKITKFKVKENLEKASIKKKK